MKSKQLVCVILIGFGLSQKEVIAVDLVTTGIRVSNVNISISGTENTIESTQGKILVEKRVYAPTGIATPISTNLSEQHLFSFENRGITTIPSGLSDPGQQATANISADGGFELKTSLKTEDHLLGAYGTYSKASIESGNIPFYNVNTGYSTWALLPGQTITASLFAEFDVLSAPNKAINPALSYNDVIRELPLNQQIYTEASVDVVILEECGGFNSDHYCYQRERISGLTGFTTRTILRDPGIFDRPHVLNYGNLLPNFDNKYEWSKEISISLANTGITTRRGLVYYTASVSSGITLMPEPSTYAFMGLGLVAVVFGANHRRTHGN